MEMSKGVQIAVGASAVALLLGWYGLTNLEAGATYRYYQTLSEYRAAGGKEMYAPGQGHTDRRVLRCCGRAHPLTHTSSRDRRVTEPP